MAITRGKKEQLVAEYLRHLQGCEAIIVTDNRGMTVSEVQELRTKIREAEGSYVIVKNTLAQIALEQMGLPSLKGMIKGPVGIGFCGHNVPGVAKAVTDFAKSKDALEIKGGLLGNRIIDENGVKNLATLPSLDVLRGQLLGVISAPASQLVGVVAGGVRQLVNVVHAYADKDQEAAAEAESEAAEA